MPSSASVLNDIEPMYETFEGWQEPTTECRTFDDLPAAAQRYLKRIEELVGAQIAMVSVGPERDQVIEHIQIFLRSATSISKRLWHYTTAVSFWRRRRDLNP